MYSKTRHSFRENIKVKLSKPFGYVVWCLTILLVISAVRNFGKVAAIKNEIQKEKSRIAKIEAENRELEAKIVETQSMEFVEKEIRNKLGLVKTGEVVVVLPDKEVLKKLAPEIEDDKEVLPDPNWKKWAKLFGVAL